MKTLIGRKIGMGQIFTDTGAMVPVTVIEAGPCVVTQLKSVEKDGYRAAQIGFGTAKKMTKALQGHFKASKANPRLTREIKLEDEDNANVGDKLDVSLFEGTKLVNVRGLSKGKGFAGGVKRHNMARGPKSHGSDSYRAIGSIGSMYPQKIWKGKRMPGHMGHQMVSMRNLTLEQIQPERNLLLVRGAVPGPRGTILEIKGVA